MARVIAGSAKGLPLKVPKRNTTRPTGDRIKESLFNILGAKVIGARVLDVFSGTGALGIEALSRGAESAVFIENNREALMCLRDNIERSRMTARTVVISSRELPNRRHFERTRFGNEPLDLVFADPPYDQGYMDELISWIEKEPPLAPGSILIVERSEKEEIPEGMRNMSVIRENRYGNTILSFLRCNRS